MSEIIITISIDKEGKKDALVKLLKFNMDKAYYVIYSYREFNVDISPYKEIFSDLKKNENFGIIKITENDIKNTTIIEDMFLEYQDCSLTVSENHNILDVYSYESLRFAGKEKWEKVFGSFRILEYNDEFISYMG